MQDLNSSESQGFARPLEHELFSWNDYPPFHNLPTQDELFSALVAAHSHVVTGQIGESTRQIPEAMVSIPNSREYPSDRFGTLVNDQIRTDGEPEYITYQNATLLPSEGRSLRQGAKSPFDQTLNFSAFGCPSSSRDTQGYTGTHTMPPSEHHWDQIVETPEPTGPHQIPKSGSAPDSKSGITAAEWHCHYGECKKKYRRPQSLIRHIRDKHEIPRWCCVFCGTKWTRAYKIRSHYITQHSEQLTNEEREEIKRLRGRNNTIRFFEEW